jgi:hypothetical protein
VTTTSRDQDTAEATEMRAEIAKTQAAARAAVNALDVSLGIALLRTLRSQLWRAKNQGVIPMGRDAAE